MYDTLALVSNILVIIGSVIGMYLLSEKDKLGFVIFTFAEISILYLGLVTQNYGLAITGLLYILMNIYGYIKWEKEDATEESR